MQQRKFERFAVNGSVAFLGDKARGEGRIENLSLGGAAIVSDVKVAKSEYLRLSMTWPNRTDRIDVDLAPVRWIKEGSFGVEFIRVNPTALQMLRRFIEQLGLVPDEPASSNL